MRRLIALSLSLCAAPAAAQDADFCADRPGLGTPACTMPAGQVMAELGVAGWDHSADPATVEDDLTYGDLLVRLGIDDRTEVEVGFGGYGTVRSRDRFSGNLSRSHGLGDVSIAVRRSVSGPGGPVALHVYATLPTGADGIGAGDWSAGALLPIDLNLPAGFEIDLTPEVDAAVDASGHGRHLAWGGVAGLAHPAGRNLSLEAEIGAWRDNDPAGHATDVRAALSLAWQAGKDWQIDLEGDAGLSAAAPRHSLLIGMARRF
jgi:hypothetical protein